jgi:hypothetical protein
MEGIFPRKPILSWNTLMLVFGAALIGWCIANLSKNPKSVSMLIWGGCLFLIGLIIQLWNRGAYFQITPDAITARYGRAPGWSAPWPMWNGSAPKRTF